MKCIFRISILFLLSITAVSAQGKYVPNGIRVGGNLVKLANTLLDDQVKNYEVTGDIGFNKYLLTVDLGQAILQRQGNDFMYQTEGVYYKLGIDVNFLNNLEGNHALGLGFRYARSSYNNDLHWNVTDDLWGNNKLTISNNRASSQWFEGLAMLKVNTWYNIQLGFTFGMKFARSDKGVQQLDAYEIPGYGYGEATSLWMFNYYIYYYIPFKR